MVTDIAISVILLAEELKNDHIPEVVTIAAIHILVWMAAFAWLLYLSIFHIMLNFKGLTTYEYIQIWRASNITKVHDCKDAENS